MELLQDTELAQSQRQLLDTARSCGEQLAIVINDILDLCRLQVCDALLLSLSLALRSLLGYKDHAGRGALLATRTTCPALFVLGSVCG